MSTSMDPHREPGEGGAPRALTVSQLNRLAKDLLEQGIGETWLTAEISGFKAYPTGHWYFSLKDENSSISAAMFAGRNRSCRIRPQDGMQVLVRGRVSLFEKQGRYQILVDEMQAAGEGALYAAYEKLKARLQAEGLFAEDRKRPLPLLPRRIGIATSSAGAALRDILKVLESRRTRVSVVIAPCRVQGDGSADEIAAALRRLDALGDVDVVIVGRGGGSLEDLWAFNEEPVIRQIAAMSIPVISAVGHEVDVTLSDLVADRRAATPSQAAEIVCASADDVAEHVRATSRRLAQAARATCREVQLRLVPAQPDRLRLLLRGTVESRLQHATELGDRLTRSLRQLVRARRLELGATTNRLSPASLRQVMMGRRQLVTERERELAGLVRRALERRRERVTARLGALQALSPLAVLDRGYAVLLTDAGRAVRSAGEVTIGETVTARLSRGRLGLTVNERNEET